MDDKKYLLQALDAIDPSACDYTTWIKVGMALKHEGFTCADWNRWSQRDPDRYKASGPDSCWMKWDTFDEMTESIVTGGTIIELARQNGWRPARDDTLYDWDSIIQDDGEDDYDLTGSSGVVAASIPEVTHWDPVEQMVTYLETLFKPEDYVGYNVTASKQEDRNKWTPMDSGVYTRTAGELIKELRACKGDTGEAIGDYNEEAGAWIRFNPLDGEGCKDANVTDYRYALVESDVLSLEEQYAKIKELELPVAILVHSGGKSLHAIVKVMAVDRKDYFNKVNFLYKVCGDNNLKIDTQNRNPSRLSRLPGIVRGAHRQYIVAKNLGKHDFDEWKDYIEGQKDSLPDLENLGDCWDNLPPLAPELIHGVLRRGHKMLIAGPSKAGKSFLLMELAVAIANGSQWVNWQCEKGSVMYVNLEIDRASFLWRFAKIFKAMGISQDRAKEISNRISVWNLRGESEPLNKLVGKLIRRAQTIRPAAIIIDPIYKVITGDENSADQMALFCNQFDMICKQVECSVIYCHHHSKGAQGGKRAIDRASGSGVFARDPDAFLDLIELEKTDEVNATRQNDEVCRTLGEWLLESGIDPADPENGPSMDNAAMSGKLLSWIKENMPDRYEEAQAVEMATRDRCMRSTAWRVEGVLREFSNFPPVNLWFDYPIHRPDDKKLLTDIEPDHQQSHKRATAAHKSSSDSKVDSQVSQFVIAYSGLEQEGRDITAADMAEALSGTWEQVSSAIICDLLAPSKNTKLANMLKKSFRKEENRGANGATLSPKIIRIDEEG